MMCLAGQLEFRSVWQVDMDIRANVKHKHSSKWFQAKHKFAWNIYEIFCSVCKWGLFFWGDRIAFNFPCVKSYTMFTSNENIFMQWENEIFWKIQPINSVRPLAPRVNFRTFFSLFRICGQKHEANVEYYFLSTIKCREQIG